MTWLRAPLWSVMILGLELGSAPKAIIPILKGKDEQGRGWQKRPGGRRVEGIQVEATAGAEAKGQFAG